MNKKIAHCIFFLLDILCLFIFLFFYNEIRQVLLDIRNQAEMVTIWSKEGFFIFAIALPIIHITVIIEYFNFEIIKKHAQSIGYGFIAMLILMFVSAFVTSSLIKAKAENAGYINCRELEWSGTYSVSYTYTRNQEICERLVTEKGNERNRRLSLRNHNPDSLN